MLTQHVDKIPATGVVNIIWKLYTYCAVHRSAIMFQRTLTGYFVIQTTRQIAQAHFLGVWPK